MTGTSSTASTSSSIPTPSPPTSMRSSPSSCLHSSGKKKGTAMIDNRNYPATLEELDEYAQQSALPLLHDGEPFQTLAQILSSNTTTIAGASTAEVDHYPEA